MTKLDRNDNINCLKDKKRVFLKPNIFSDQFLEYSMKLNSFANNQINHKRHVPFHTMNKAMDCKDLPNDFGEILLKINAEFDGVESDYIMYEEWLVNGDRKHKKRRYIFR